MNNKALLIFAGIAFGFALVGFILGFLPHPQPVSEKMTTWGMGLGNLACLLFLLRNSQIRRTVYFPILAVFVSLFFIAILWKIRHWPSADEFLIVSLLGITVTYGIRFLKKTRKSGLDIIIFLWVVSYCATFGLIYLHRIAPVWRFIPILFLWGATVAMIQHLKKQNLLEI